MKVFLKSISLALFGIACAALGQYDYCAEFMSNPAIILLMFIGSGTLLVLLTED